MPRRNADGGPYITKQGALMKVTMGKGKELCYVHDCQNKPVSIIVWPKRADKARVWVCKSHEIYG